MTRLPEPDPQSQALSRELSARIARRIQHAGGWIGFDEYMSMALYEPGLGYYANGRTVFGPAGDFVTAPELSPLFGATLCNQVAAWLANPALAAKGEPTVVEFGAGSGALATQLLNGLARAGFDAVRYLIVEPSAALRHQQAARVAALSPELASRVQWLDRLPDAIDGVIVANEVLDAIPVRTVEWDGKGWLEMGVAIAESRSNDNECADSNGRGADDRFIGSAFVWKPRPADDALVADLHLNGRNLPAPFRTEVAPQVQGWLRTVGSALRTGAMLLIDYGFPAREYYHPQRSGGTLMGHYRHYAHTDPFALPGLQDITAHVDFSRVAAAGLEVGLELIGFTSQGRFLINSGLIDAIESLPRESNRVWFSQAEAVQRLMSEAEMGELFKVIAFGRGLGELAGEPGFMDGDRSAALSAPDAD